MGNNYTFTVTTEEINLILAALGELPAKTTMGLITNLQNQAQPKKEISEEEVGEE